jgi:hypothetical protein
MILVRQNGDHQTVMHTVLESFGYGVQAIEAMGVYNISLISLITPQHLETYETIALDNKEFILGMIKEFGTVKAPLYFLQEWMAKWDNDKIREYAINKELDLREVLQNHWDLTVEELKNETFQIIGE